MIKPFRIIVILMCFVTSTSNLWAQDVWTVDSARIDFRISNAGFDVEGEIALAEADIQFSSRKLSKSSFSASVDAGSIETGINLRDKHLKKGDYFDVLNYPAITVASNEITKTKEGYSANGTITMKGQTRDIVIPFTFSERNNMAEIKGSFPINRLDFNIGEESMILSDSVFIDVWLNVSLKEN